MGIEAIYRRPNTSKPTPGHKIYPYLLRGMKIERPNQVWATDISYIPMRRGFVYLVAVVDVFTRRVLSHRLSITMEAEFCVEALKEALAKYGKPEIFNTDHPSSTLPAGFSGPLGGSATEFQWLRYDLGADFPDLCSHTRLQFYQLIDGIFA